MKRFKVDEMIVEDDDVQEEQPSIEQVTQNLNLNLIFISNPSKKDVFCFTLLSLNHLHIGKEDMERI